MSSSNRRNQNKSGDVLNVDFSTGEICNETTGACFKADISSLHQEMIAADGLVNYLKKGMNT